MDQAVTLLKFRRKEDAERKAIGDIENVTQMNNRFSFFLNFKKYSTLNIGNRFL